MQQVSKEEFASRLAATRGGVSSDAALLGASRAPSSADVETVGAATLRSTSKGSAKQNPFEWKTPTVVEQRGPAGISNVKPAKNVAAHSSELSLPIATGPNHPEKIARVQCDVVKYCQHAVALTGTSVFTKDQCSTAKGWSSGKF